MRSADECFAKAKDLTDRAALSLEVGPELLEMAEHWLDLAQVAEWQDGFRIQTILDAYRRQQ